MRTAVLHIGTGKTGTTSLQTFLKQNSARLAYHGVGYPDFLGRRNHIQLALPFTPVPVAPKAERLKIHNAADEREFLKNLHTKFKKNVRAHDRWVFSSEHMWSRLDEPGYVGALKSFLDKHFDNYSIIMYVRRQDYFLPTWASTVIATGRTLYWVPEYYNSYLPMLNYAGSVDLWAEAFGPDSMTIRPYLERYKSDNGAVINDFLDVLGLPVEGSWDYPERAFNPKLSAEGLAVVRELLPDLPDKSRAARWALVRATAEVCKGPSIGLPHDAAVALLDRYADGNAEFAHDSGDSELWAEWFAQPVADTGVPELPIVAPERLSELTGELYAKM